MKNDSWTTNVDQPGILQRDDITRLAQKKDLVNPAPQQGSSQYQPASFDLTAGRVILPDRIVSGDKFKEQGYTLGPGDIATFLTLEELNMPRDVAANVFPINALSRQGLLVLNPGHIDPDYRGVISVKLINVKNQSHTLFRGEEIFTAIFRHLPKPAPQYPGEYKSREERARAVRHDAEQMAPSAMVEIQEEGIQEMIEGIVEDSMQARDNNISQRVTNLRQDIEQDYLKTENFSSELFTTIWFWGWSILVFILGIVASHLPSIVRALFNSGQ